jgi:predicted nucleic acid-binding protein
MAWLTSLKGKIVGLDTMPLIYFIEGTPVYRDTIHSFFKFLQDGKCSVVTSTITLLETLVVPLRKDNKYLINKYRNILLKTDGLTVLAVSSEIAQEAAKLRAEHQIYTADAIQLATAIKAGASFFLTNDSALPSLPNLQV